MSVPQTLPVRPRFDQVLRGFHALRLSRARVALAILLLASHAGIASAESCYPPPRPFVPNDVAALEIVDGDNTPDTDDDTDFGTQLANMDTDRIFTIKNTGGAILNLTGSPIVSISGDSEVSVFTQPAAGSIAHSHSGRIR